MLMENGELSINNEGEVLERKNYPATVRFFAQLFSYLFHPLFIPLYVTFFLVFIHSNYFVGFGIREKIFLLVRVSYQMIFYPLVAVLLLNIISNIFFFWAYLVFRNQPEIPTILTSFTFAVFISSSAALMANIYFKISMHAIGMGGVLGLFFVIMQQNNMLMTVPLSIAFLITGIVCTSRLIVSDHSTKEIYAGLLMGIVCQLVAAVMYL
jgi:hypothetical protein